MSNGPDVIRNIEICAPRDLVFSYFTNSERFAKWWGEGSTVDPKPGGALFVRYPNGESASGKFKEITPPERVVFTFGYEGEGKPVPPGGSTVIVTFQETTRGTLVTLRHTDLPSEEVSKHHIQGWRYQMSLYSKVVAAEQHANANEIADKWFSCWNETEPELRSKLLRQCAAPEIVFFDDYGSLSGYEDLEGQIAAVHLYMPGTLLRRAGDVVQNHGNGLVRWEIHDPEGNAKGKGTNTMSFAPDGRLQKVVGFWGA